MKKKCKRAFLQFSELEKVILSINMSFFLPSRPDLVDSKNRRHYEALRGRVDSGESTSLMRSLLGVQPFCIHDEAQFSCTFTPFCWMQGGVAMNGCDSMLYSCCVSHTIARRQVRLSKPHITLNSGGKSAIISGNF